MECDDVEAFVQQIRDRAQHRETETEKALAILAAAIELSTQHPTIH